MRANVNCGMDSTSINTKKTTNQSHIDAFKASMDAKDRLIHELAEKMLKTRYSVERSNGFKKFLSKNP
jgi:hypothetical protein